ncbi:MAG TPA: cupin domain-containing protein [Gemmataceae bacterium]|nr:cupin domain-containing protein [Gemmataceae bacterium]
MLRDETVTRGDCPPAAELAPGVRLRVFVSGELGARGLSTGTATVEPGAKLPYHVHPCSEAVTVVSGRAEVEIEGRRYHLAPHDAMHVPAGVAHETRNAAADAPAVLLWSFASDRPTRELVQNRFRVTDCAETGPDCPEHLTRFAKASAYELAPRAFFRDLFAGRFGARGICGGYGVLEPGAELPCHVHAFDESMTIVTGRAVCQIAGKEYALSNCDTAWIPSGRPHRIFNRSEQPMAMIWVYAGDEPDQTLVDAGYCDGTTPL